MDRQRQDINDILLVHALVFGLVLVAFVGVITAQFVGSVA